MPVDLLAEKPKRQPRDLLGRQPQHREFDGSGIPGFNPETGMVEQGAPEASMPRTTAAIMGIVEGLPVVGPYARQGVEAASAGIGSALTGQPYEQVRSEIGGMTQQAEQAHPGIDFAGNVFGALGGTLPMVMAAPAAFGAGSGGLLARSGASALSGAALGGTDAAVRSGGDMDAVKSGALWGFGLGAAAPGVGQVVGKGASKVAERFRGPTAAERVFGRAAGADAVDDVAGRLAAMGDDAMPMDLGPNLQRQAGALAATPGRGQEIVRSSVAARQAGAGGRVAGALDDALGQTTDTIALADDIIKGARQQAGPLYHAAYSKPVRFTNELETLLKRPTVAQALREARKMAADDETFDMAARGWFADVADDGAVQISRTPSVYELDMTKRALDDLYAAAKRGGSDNNARIVDQLRKNLTRLVDADVPEYATARKVYAGPASVKESLEEGQKAFRNSLTPNQMRTQLMKMGEAEKEAYLQGARAQIADMMGTARNDALKVRGEFQKGYNQEKLELLIGKDQAKRLLDSLDAETAFTRTRDVVTGNSETAARAAAMEEVGGKAGRPGMFRSALNMRFGDAIADVGDRAMGGVKAGSRSKANEELARLLTSKDPQAVTRAIKLVQAAQKRGDITAQKAREMIQGAMLGGSQRRRPLEVTVTP